MLTSTARSLSLSVIQLYIFSFSGRGAGEAFELSLHRKFTFLSVRSNVVLSQFTAWCNHHHNLIWKQLHHSIKDPCTLSSHSPTLPPPASGTHSAIFCLSGFAISGHFMSVEPCSICSHVSSLTQHPVSETHLCCSMRPAFPLTATQYSTVWIHNA